MRSPLPREPRPSESAATTQPPSVRSIHATLRRDIVTLRLMPGARLSENELAQRFGISRAPVREALIRLVEEDLIMVLPQRGSFVSQISLKAMRRARFVREALEVATVRRAAGEGLPPAVLARLETAVADQEASRANSELFSAAEDAFHRALADGIELEGLWAVVEREKAQFDRVRFLSLPMVTPVDLLIRQHRAILAAVVARDPAAAEAAMREHLSEVLKIASSLAERHPDLIVAN